MFDLKDIEIIEVHGFSDASLKAYATVIHIRFKLKDGSYCVNFVASKTKKALQKEKRNNSKIRINGRCTFESTNGFGLLFIKFNLKYMKRLCWTGTDPLDCLFWIDNTKKNLKQVIQMRVLEIRDTFPTAKITLEWGKSYVTH